MPFLSLSVAVSCLDGDTGELVGEAFWNLHVLRLLDAVLMVTPVQLLAVDPSHSRAGSPGLLPPPSTVCVSHFGVINEDERQHGNS